MNRSEETVFDTNPKTIVCPCCNATVSTKVKYQNGKSVYVTAAGVALSGFILGCCLAPFFFEDLKDIVHCCPSCKEIVGMVKKDI